MISQRFDFAQDAIFEPEPQIPVARVSDPNERARLHRQSRVILERLRRGPMANVDMAHLAKKYTNRVSEIRVHLRQQGESVEVIERNRKTGYTLYSIVSWPKEER